MLKMSLKQSLLEYISHGMILNSALKNPVVLTMYIYILADCLASVCT